MANVFKAKEANKKVPGTINPNKPMVAVHGLYVAGMWRPPYWIDTTLNMTKIGGSQAADIVYYTTSTEYPRLDVGVTMVDMSIDASNINIQKFTTSSASSWFDVGVTMVDISIDVSNMNVLKYTRSTERPKFDVGVTMVDMSMDLSNMNIFKTIPKDGTQPPGQPLLNIKTLSTTNASIT